MDDIVVETMWAIVIDKEKGIYKLDNIPFYGPPVATEDIFTAKYSAEDEFLVFDKVIEESGNSIIQVLVNENEEIQKLRDFFSDLKCDSEKMNDKFFVLEISKDVNYSVIKRELDKLENNELIEYAEPSLSVIHKNQI